MTKQEHWVSVRGCVYNVYYHFVWSTKYRRKVLVGSVAEDLHWLHEMIAEQKGISLVDQEIMPDHVHLFVTAHPIFAPANIVKIFKGMIRREHIERLLLLALRNCGLCPKPNIISNVILCVFPIFSHARLK